MALNCPIFILIVLLGGVTSPAGRLTSQRSLTQTSDSNGLLDSLN